MTTGAPPIAITKASAPLAFTVECFCEAYGIGRTFTYDEIKAGRLRAVKAGARTLILREDAERWARSLPTVESASDRARFAAMGRRSGRARAAA